MADLKQRLPRRVVNDEPFCGNIRVWDATDPLQSQRIQVNSSFDARFSSPCWIICVKLSVEVNVFDPILAAISKSIMGPAVRL